MTVVVMVEHMYGYAKVDRWWFFDFGVKMHQDTVFVRDF